MRISLSVCDSPQHLSVIVGKGFRSHTLSGISGLSVQNAMASQQQVQEGKLRPRSLLEQDANVAKDVIGFMLADLGNDGALPPKLVVTNAWFDIRSCQLSSAASECI